jgi:hypothetical protein
VTQLHSVTPKDSVRVFSPWDLLLLLLLLLLLASVLYSQPVQPSCSYLNCLIILICWSCWPVLPQADACRGAAA